MHPPHTRRNPKLHDKHTTSPHKPFIKKRPIDRRKGEKRKPSVESVADGIHHANDDGAFFGVGAADFARSGLGILVGVFCCDEMRWGRNGVWDDLLCPGHTQWPVWYVHAVHEVGEP